MFNLFSKKNSVAELEQKYAHLKNSIPILKGHWISHWFALQYDCPKKLSEHNFLNFLEDEQLKIHGFVLPRVLGLSGKSSSIKSFKIEDLPRTYQRALEVRDNSKDTYFMLIRFPDIRKEDSENGNIMRTISPAEKRHYGFTPLQSLRMGEICGKIELQLQAVTGFKPHELMTLTVGVDNEIIIVDFDGLQYISYPLIKRIELFVNYPDLEDKVFEYVIPFKKFVKWILEKENDSEAMKNNCQKVRNMLKMFRIKV